MLRALEGRVIRLLLWSWISACAPGTGFDDRAVVPVDTSTDADTADADTADTGAAR